LNEHDVPMDVVVTENGHHPRDRYQHERAIRSAFRNLAVLECAVRINRLLYSNLQKFGRVMPAGEQRSGRSITWLVAPGLGMIAVTYGLARFAYGLFLPEMREALDLSETVLGLIGAGSYAAYCFAVVIALVFTSRTGPRFMAVAAGAVAVVGMAAVAGARAAWVLALGILVAGSASGLASPPMGEAVATSIREEFQDRANTLINSGTSIGIALSGSAALLVAERWRVAWTAFALIGSAVIAWNAMIIMMSRHR